jgi:hypothetical protein
MKIKLLNLAPYCGVGNIKFPVIVECSGEFDLSGDTEILGSEIIRLGGNEDAFIESLPYTVYEDSFELIETQNKTHWTQLEAGDIILVEGVERTVDDIEYLRISGTDLEGDYTISLKEEDVGDLECTCGTWFNTQKHPWSFVRKAGQKAEEVTSEEGEEIPKDVSEDFLYIADYGSSGRMLSVEKLTFDSIMLQMRSYENRFLAGVTFTPEQTIEFAEDLLRLANQMIEDEGGK